MINFQKNSVLRYVALLASGTALAQAISLLASPLLTRLYTPKDFGLLAVFMALVSSITPMVTGKYEVAMVVPKQNTVASELFGAAFWSGIVVFILFFLFVGSFQEILLEWLGAPELAGWVLLAPLVLILTGFFNLAGYLANRCKQYSLMAHSTMLRSFVMVGCCLILGIVETGFLGLLLGNILGLIVAFSYLIYLQRSSFSLKIFKLNKRKAAVARKYIEYPAYNASSALLNGITLSLPVFFLTHYFPGEVVGYYALVIRVLNAPLTFVATAVSQVNLKKVVDLVNSGSRVEPYLYKATCCLFLFACLPAVILVLWAPRMFPWVFGVEWSEAGSYAQIIAFSLVARFVASTLSTTLGATRNNRLVALWRIVAFVSTLVVLGFVVGQGSVEKLLVALVINDIVLYFFYYYLIVKSVRNFRK